MIFNNCESYTSIYFTYVIKYWIGLGSNPAGVNSVAVLVVHLTIVISDRGHNLRLTRHAVNEYGGWAKIVKLFRLSHKPMGLASIARLTVY